MNPANSSMVEAAPAMSTCGKYQRILTANIGWLLILTLGRSRPYRVKRGIRYNMKNSRTNCGGWQHRMRFCFFAWFLEKVFVQFGRFSKGLVC